MIDELLLNFVRENPFTIGIIIGIIKIVANELDWVVDNRIMSLLTLRGWKNGSV